MKKNTIKSSIPVDDDENDENDIEIIKQQKKQTFKSAKNKKGKFGRDGISSTEFIQVKEEDMTFVEYVLGDFQNLNSLKNFEKMTSLSLVNQNINSIIDVVKNIPIKENIIFLCLNENNISEIKDIENLLNLKELQLNFNKITKIGECLTKMCSLKKIWVCENQIEKIENLPDCIEEFWIANNLIQSIPKEIEKYQEIVFLNLAGNLIINLQDIYNIQNLKKLKKLYLFDVNFGENPICQYLNYRSLIIHFLENIENLDQILISPEEKKEIENMYTKKYLFFKNKIRQTHKISKMIFQLLKTNQLFMNALKFHQSCFFSQRKKMLEFAKYEKKVLQAVNDTSIDEIEKEIGESEKKLNICLKLVDSTDNSMKSIKKYISEINNLSICGNFFEMETNGNFKVEPGNSTLKWTKSCIELIKARTSRDFMERNQIKGFSFHKTFKVINKKSKILFDSLYDNLIDINGKFGDEKKYFDFFFLLLPKEKLNYHSIFSIVFEDEPENQETPMILCDNVNQLDEKLFKENPNQRFIAVICKCVILDNEFESVQGMKQMDDYATVLSECLQANSKKNILKIVREQGSFYYYKLSGLAIPEYIIEYEYESKMENDQLLDDSGFISSFNLKVNINEHYEEVFNSCSKDLFGKDNKQFFSKDMIAKYSSCKFGEFKELDNGLLFFVKNSIMGYILKCFKFQKYDDYKTEIIRIKERIKEITNLKFQKNIKQVIFSSEEREKINISQIKEINLFNVGYNDEIFKSFLEEIISTSESTEELKNLRNNVTDLFIAKNEIEILDLNKILEAFPNLITIDCSHNNITNIIYDKKRENHLENIDLTFNDITDYAEIIQVYKLLDHLKFFSYFANPYAKHFNHFSESPSDSLITLEKKENIIREYNKYLESKNENCQKIKDINSIDKINLGVKNFDVIFDCYSIGEAFHEFSNNKYFREKVDSENNYKSLILSKRKLLSIPTVDNQKDIQLLYINLNKISKIKNLSQFPSLLELYIQNNKITKIENLPRALRKLDISNNELTILDGIENAEELRWLNCENNAIRSISQLISLSKLNELYSAGNFIENVKECYSLRQLPNLEIVDISSNEVCRTCHEIRLGMIFYCKKVKNFNRINVDDSEREKAQEYFTGKLTSEILEQKIGQNYNTKNLKILDLSSLKLKDEVGMFSLENYPLLEKLNLSKNLFKSFQIFGYLPKLSELNLNYNLVTTILNKGEKKPINKGVFGLPNLESLEMAGNTISNLNGIQALKNLKILVLRENNINKIDAINKMNELTFLDLCFNKLRTVDRTNIGILPNLKILLCDNNFLKNVNAFAKLEALQTLSFENNKIYDYSSIDKLMILEELRDFSILNNPLTKLANYRTRMIKLFDKLLKLDGIEITTEERDMIAMEMQMGDYVDDSIANYFNNGFSGQKGNPNFIKSIQDKGLKKVNYIQLDLLSPMGMGMLGGGRIGSPKNIISLPQIKPFNYGTKEKPPTSDTRKRFTGNTKNKVSKYSKWEKGKV